MFWGLAQVIRHREEGPGSGTRLSDSGPLFYRKHTSRGQRRELEGVDGREKTALGSSIFHYHSCPRHSLPQTPTSSLGRWNMPTTVPIASLPALEAHSAASYRPSSHLDSSLLALGTTGLNPLPGPGHQADQMHLPDPSSQAA